MTHKEKVKIARKLLHRLKTGDPKDGYLPNNTNIFKNIWWRMRAAKIKNQVDKKKLKIQEAIKAKKNNV